MAQPLFDQHPLGDYFRYTGEVPEPMPGGSPDFALEEDDSIDNDDNSLQLDIQLPQPLARALQIASDLLQSSSCTSHENSFAERFKYDVISSSLLSSSLAASAAPTSAVRRSFTPELPGKLDDSSGVGDDEPFSTVSHDHRFQERASSSNTLGTQIPVALLSLAVFVISAGHYLLAIIPLGAAIYARYVIYADADRDTSTAQILDSLNELISAGNVWDSAVNEAILLVESEERSIFYGPTSTQAPSSAVRIALQSSLHTTQTQCDNVRQLISALTDPASLSQLAEMYAPPSPVRPALTLSDGQRSPSSPGTVRPFSHPSGTWSQRTTSLPSSNANKRATWNGSYAALALAGSPTAHLVANRKKQNRHSDIQSLFQHLPAPADGQIASFSTPVSPQHPSPIPERLEALEEEEGSDEELADKNYFGAAALDLQRKRKSAGLETFGVPPPSYTPPKSPKRASMQSTQAPPFLSPTFASSSRLTTVHTTRHPLSLSGLHLALQGALSSKRYACSHLLALRFSEDEDDSYWENVHSVMALLSSTFSDAASRLIEALDEAEKRRIKDEHPTPPRGNSPTPQGRGHRRNDSKGESPLRHEYVPARTMAEMISFAPMPSNMARLAGHVDAISSALNDARDYMEECITTLRNPSIVHTHVRSESQGGESAPPSVQDHPAFQAYDRLRKELGFALRECERGRERLLDILAPRPLTDAADDDATSPNTPGLNHDSGSESSEKGPTSPNVHNGEPGGGPGLGLTLSFGRDHDHEHEHELDDATAHLLLTASSQHLPPPGVEQVYEAETGNSAGFTRARSKLSREDRIKIMKARRASGVPVLGTAMFPDHDVEDQTERPGRERWGPGGEVVQELKDVIWKVGEKRRRMSQHVSGEERGVERERETVLAQVPELEPIFEMEAGASTSSVHEAPPSPDASLALKLPERETSILISVDEGSPIFGVHAIGDAQEPEPEDQDRDRDQDEDEEESGLAYLDSPSPSRAPELPAEDLHVYVHTPLTLDPELCLADDTLRTTPGLDLEGTGSLSDS